MKRLRGWKSSSVGPYRSAKDGSKMKIQPHYINYKLLTITKLQWLLLSLFNFYNENSAWDTGVKYTCLIVYLMKPYNIFKIYPQNIMVSISDIRKTQMTKKTQTFQPCPSTLPRMCCRKGMAKKSKTGGGLGKCLSSWRVSILA